MCTALVITTLVLFIFVVNADLTIDVDMDKLPVDSEEVVNIVMGTYIQFTGVNYDIIGTVKDLQKCETTTNFVVFNNTDKAMIFNQSNTVHYFSSNPSSGFGTCTGKKKLKIIVNAADYDISILYANKNQVLLLGETISLSYANDTFIQVNSEENCTAVQHASELNMSPAPIIDFNIAKKYYFSTPSSDGLCNGHVLIVTAVETDVQINFNTVPPIHELFIGQSISISYPGTNLYEVKSDTDCTVIPLRGRYNRSPAVVKDLNEITTRYFSRNPEDTNIPCNNSVIIIKVRSVDHAIMWNRRSAKIQIIIGETISITESYLSPFAEVRAENDCTPLHEESIFFKYPYTIIDFNIVKKHYYGQAISSQCHGVLTVDVVPADFTINFDTDPDFLEIRAGQTISLNYSAVNIYEVKSKSDCRPVSPNDQRRLNNSPAPIRLYTRGQSHFYTEVPTDDVIACMGKTLEIKVIEEGHTVIIDVEEDFDIHKNIERVLEIGDIVKLNLEVVNGDQYIDDGIMEIKAVDNCEAVPDGRALWNSPVWLSQFYEVKTYYFANTIYGSTDCKGRKILTLYVVTDAEHVFNFTEIASNDINVVTRMDSTIEIDQIIELVFSEEENGVVEVKDFNDCEPIGKIMMKSTLLAGFKDTKNHFFASNATSSSTDCVGRKVLFVHVLVHPDLTINFAEDFIVGNIDVGVIKHEIEIGDTVKLEFTEDDDAVVEVQSAEDCKQVNETDKPFIETVRLSDFDVEGTRFFANKASINDSHCKGRKIVALQVLRDPELIIDFTKDFSIFVTRIEHTVDVGSIIRIKYSDDDKGVSAIKAPDNCEKIGSRIPHNARITIKEPKDHCFANKAEGNDEVVCTGKKVAELKVSAAMTNILYLFPIYLLTSGVVFILI